MIVTTANKWIGHILPGKLLNVFTTTTGVHAKDNDRVAAIPSVNAAGGRDDI